MIFIVGWPKLDRYHMKVLVCFFVTLMIIFFPALSYACTIYDGRIPAKTVKELYEGSDLVFKGKAVYIDDRVEQNTQFNRKVGLQILNTYKIPSDEKVETIELLYHFVLGSYCGTGGTHFETGKVYFVTAKRLVNGRNLLLHTSGKYGLGYLHDESQWDRFFTSGVDSPLLDEYCLKGLKQMYPDDIIDSTKADQTVEYAQCADGF